MYLGAGALNGKDLLSNDGENLQVDPVKLVEAGPSARGSETLEELAHCLGKGKTE